VRHFDIRAQAEEDVSDLAGGFFFAPDAAIAEIGNGADAVVERDAFLRGFVCAPLAGASQSSTSVSDRSAVEQPATLAAAASASPSVQLLSMVLARSPGCAS
jgi:hypothetical protein